MRIKFEFGRKTYQHVLVDVVPSVVELAHAALKPRQVLHGVPGAAAVQHNLPVLAHAEGGFGNIGGVPFIDIPLKHAQVGRAAVQLDNPACLCRDLLADGDRSSPGMECEALGAGGLSYRGLDGARELFRGNCGAPPRGNLLAGRSRRRFLERCRRRYSWAFGRRGRL